MRRISKKPVKEMTQQTDCLFGHDVEPIASVSPGEEIAVETYDCFGDAVNPERDWAKLLLSGEEVFENPITGPIYVEGAEPGDTLVVEIRKIELGERGVTALVPGFGLLEGWFRQVPPLSKFSKVRGRHAVFPLSKGRAIKIPVRPMIGTIGVAPPVESISTVTPSRHGGNLDTPQVTAGNRLHLPVFVKGALFALGDVHAGQGHGEVCGTGIEVPAVVRLKFELLKGKRIDWPRIESPHEIMTVCSARPLEDAAKLAVWELVRWLKSDFGLDEYDAYMLLSAAGDVDISQIVDSQYTVVAKIRKDLIRQLK